MQDTHEPDQSFVRLGFISWRVLAKAARLRRAGREIGPQSIRVVFPKAAAKSARGRANDTGQNFAESPDEPHDLRQQNGDEETD